MTAPDRRKPQSKAIAKAQDGTRKALASLGLGALIALGAAVAAKADGHETIIESHAFSTFGDFKYGPNQPYDYVNVDAPKGGSISLWADGTFDSMNPYTRKGRAGRFSTIMYESLVESSADEVNVDYCLICTTMEYPESQDWVIFNMRDDVFFSDGTQLTAEDVKFSHDLFISDGLPSYREAVKKLVQGAEVLDTYRVKFTFQPDVPRKNLISQVGGTPIFSKAYFEKNGFGLDETRLDPGVGSGPYMFDRLDINNEIVYKRNPDYWGEDLPINQGRHNYDEIRIEYFGDSNAAFEGFKSGTYTFRIESEAEATLWASGYTFPAVTDGQVKKEEIADGNVPSNLGLVFNMRKPLLQDPKVREALSQMYNFTWANEALFNGLFKQQSSFWENSVMAAKGMPEGAELELLKEVATDDIPAGVLDKPVPVFEGGSKRQLDRKALGRATALLEEAGWVAGDDGVLRKDGEKLTLEWLGRNPQLDRVINPYVENLKRLGVDITYSRVDSSQFTSRRRAFDYDLMIGSFAMSEEPGIGLGQYFGSADMEYSTFNPAGVANGTVDALIEKVVLADNREDLAVAVSALDRTMRHMHFIVPMWYNPNYWVAYYDMYEYPENLPPYALGYLDFWWVNPEKEAALKAAGVLK